MRRVRIIRPKQKLNWFQRYSAAILAIATVVLVGITIYYAISTANLVEIANEQMILNSEPQIAFHSNLHPKLLQIKDSTITFSIENLSYSNLINFSLQLKFYFHLIDTTNKESFIEYKTRHSSLPDYYISIFPKKSVENLVLNLRPYIHSMSSDSGYFFVKRSLQGEGNWKKINLRKSFGFLFSIFEFTYQRENDGKEFTKELFFRVDSKPYFIKESIIYPEKNLEAILTVNQRIKGFWQIEGLFPKR